MKTTILGSTLIVGLLAAMGIVGCATSEPVAATGSPCQSEEKGDILDIAARAGSFTTLARAIEAAGLTEALRGEGPFTVFAPTDEAFAKLPAGTVERLLLPENRAELRDLLLGHVASGRIDASQIATMSAIPTLEGGSVPIEASAAGIMIGNSQVTRPDIIASNGVIHVIDTVILPERMVSRPQEPVTPPTGQQGAGTPQEPGMPQEPAAYSEEPGMPQEPVAPPQQSTGCPSEAP